MSDKHTTTETDKPMMINVINAAKLLGMSPSHLHYLIGKGVFSVSPRLKRNKLIPFTQLESFLAEAESNKIIESN